MLRIKHVATGSCIRMKPSKPGDLSRLAGRDKYASVVLAPCNASDPLQAFLLEDASQAPRNNVTHDQVRITTDQGFGCAGE